MTQIRNFLRKWKPGSTAFIVTSRKTEIAKSAIEPKLRWLLAQGEMEKTVPQAEKYGDAKTADHKFLKEGGESRDHHRYAVVVQDLATRWIQSHPCRTKNSQGTDRSLRKLFEPLEKPKVIYTDNSLEFGKSCEALSWNHRTSILHRSETNGVAERAVRRIEEGTSAALLQSSLDEKWSVDSVECYCNLRNIQDLLSDGKTLYERRFGEPFKGLVVPFGLMVEYHRGSAKDLSKLSPVRKENFTWNVSQIFPACGRNLEKRHFGRRH